MNARPQVEELHNAITDAGDDEPMDQEVTDHATPVAPVETSSLAEPELRVDAAQDPVAPDAVVQDAPVAPQDAVAESADDATPRDAAPLLTTLLIRLFCAMHMQRTSMRIWPISKSWLQTTRLSQHKTLLRPS